MNTLWWPRKLQLLFAGVFLNWVVPPDPLPNMKAANYMTTVSGESGGANMAAQLQVIYSDTFKGAGIFYGMPYGCVKSMTNSKFPEFGEALDYFVSNGFSFNKPKPGANLENA